VLYEDAAVRAERQKKLDADRKARNPTPTPKFAHEFGGGGGGGRGDDEDIDPETGLPYEGPFLAHRNYDPARTNALYDDAQRRREAQERVRLASVGAGG